MSASVLRHAFRSTRAGVAGAAAAALLLMAGPAAAVAVTVIAAPAALAATSCGPGDTVPPRVSSLTFAPKAVDVRGGAKTVTVTAKAADFGPVGRSASGVGGIFVSFTSPTTASNIDTASGTLHLVAGTRASGTWKGPVTIRRWVTGGTWKLTFVSATDRAGNAQTYTGSAVGSPPSSPTDIAFTTWDKQLTVTSVADNAPPQLTGFTFTPTAVNTTSTAKTVSVTAHATDARSGVASVSVSFDNPRIPNAATGTGLTHRAGTTAWVGKVVVPRWVRSSTWQASVALSDKAANFVSYDSQALATKGFRHALAVTSGTDTTKPRLTAFTFSPTSVDVRSSGAKVAISAHATDTRSGVAFVDVTFTGLGGGGASTALTRTAGTPASGTYKGSLVVPHCAPPGTWKAQVRVFDRAGNLHTYTTSALTSLGFRHLLKVTSTVVDRVAPAATATATAGSVTVTFSEGVRRVSTTTLKVYDTGDYAKPLTVSSIVCKNAAGTTVDCSGSGAGGLVRKAVVTAPVAQFKTYTVWANLGSVRAQLTDRTGNPLYWGFSAAFVFVS